MTTPAPKRDAGGLATFNILHGFTEALVRGMRSSFLKDADYHHLTQCETLDDVRLNLTETDYSESLADSSTMTPASLQKGAIEKVRIVVGLNSPSLEGVSHALCIARDGVQVSAVSGSGAPVHLFGLYHVRVHD